MSISKKIIAMAIVVITVITSLTVTAFAEEEHYGIVTASLLNIRAENNTQSTILAQAPCGSSLLVYWVDDLNWARVSYHGIEGYASGEFLNIYTVNTDEMPSRGQAVSTKGMAALEIAKSCLGIPYVYGGSSTSGFDCSGLVYYCYQQVGVTLNRVADDQMKNGVYVDKSELQPGDIIGFTSGDSSYISHVGIYAGNGMMIHAPQTGDVVKYESLLTGSYSLRYAGARRIVD